MFTLFKRNYVSKAEDNGSSCAGEGIRKFDDLRNFIVKRARAIEASDEKNGNRTKKENQKHTTQHLFQIYKITALL